MTKQATTQNQDSVSTLPAFTEVIKVEVPVQDIYLMMLATLPEDYKHRETLAHAIVGSSADAGKLTYIWKAMSGFTNDIDFKIGDVIRCTSKDRRVNTFEIQEIFGDGPQVTAVKAKYKAYDNKSIGDCTIVDIRLYSSDKIKVEYRQHVYGKDEFEITTSWVSLDSCKKWADGPELVG